MKYPIYPEHEEYDKILKAICKDNPAAYDWVIDIVAIAFLWDHIVDNDPIDTEQAEIVFEKILFHWPLNEFYQQNKIILIPTILMAVSHWRAANKGLKYGNACAIYVDLPLMVAYLIGGKIWQDKFEEPIRSITDEMETKDNERDKEI